MMIWPCSSAISPRRGVSSRADACASCAVADRFCLRIRFSSSGFHYVYVETAALSHVSLVHPSSCPRWVPRLGGCFRSLGHQSHAPQGFRDDSQCVRSTWDAPHRAQPLPSTPSPSRTSIRRRSRNEDAHRPPVEAGSRATDGSILPVGEDCGWTRVERLRTGPARSTRLRGSYLRFAPDSGPRSRSWTPQTGERGHPRPGFIGQRGMHAPQGTRPPRRPLLSVSRVDLDPGSSAHRRDLLATRRDHGS